MTTEKHYLQSGAGSTGDVRHPWHRFVAIGDSYTEGVGDPEPRSLGGLRGWADRVAEELSDGSRILRTPTSPCGACSWARSWTASWLPGWP